MRTDTVKVALAMVKYGGGFVNALGRALMQADPDNADRIHAAFGEYWAKYSEFSDKGGRRDEQ